MKREGGRKEGRRKGDEGRENEWKRGEREGKRVMPLTGDIYLQNMYMYIHAYALTQSNHPIGDLDLNSHHLLQTQLCSNPGEIGRLVHTIPGQLHTYMY